MAAIPLLRPEDKFQGFRFFCRSSLGRNSLY